VLHEFNLVCVLGDFNVPEIDWSLQSQPVDIAGNAREFFDIMLSHHCYQINSNPSNAHNNALDLIFVNSMSLIPEVHAFDLDCFPSDHAVLYYDLSTKKPQLPHEKRIVYNYKRANFDQLISELVSAPLLDLLMQASNVDELWALWQESVNKAVESCVPKITFCNSNDPPWFDGQARHLVNRKKSAWRAAKKRGGQRLWAKYRALRNEVKTTLRGKYDAYILSLADECKTNPKKFWSFFKAKTKSRSTPAVVRNDMIECTDAREKAKLFNAHFVSVFNSNMSDVLTLSGDPAPSIPVPHFSVDDVASVLSHLDVSKACTPDDIAPIVLKKCGLALAPSLAVLFNTMLYTGSVPENWKLANVIPVFKKGDKQDVANYRPISLLCIVSKVMERCIFNYLCNYLWPKIYPLQHGFMKGRSCTSQLLHVYHNIGSILDKGGQVDIVFLDFSKAFDSVPHHLLLKKLYHLFGTSGCLLDWLESYLQSRKQRVIINGAFSDWAPVSSGVPQGSIIGPQLFLLYINDMPLVASHSTVALFADDSKCFKPITCITDCQHLQQDIDQLYNWSMKNLMSFNPSKCKALTITRSRSPVDFNYTMNGVALEKVVDFKDLGVSVDPSLSFKDHIYSITSKANQVSGMIKRSIGYNAPSSVKLQLYISLCRSKLENCSQVWSPQTKGNILTIESVQRKFTKYILNYQPDLSYTERCTKLQLLPLSFRREIADLTFLYKCLHGLIDVDFTHILQFYTNSSHTRSQQCTNRLKPILVRTESFQSFYFNRAIFLWNSLPSAARNCQTLNTFRTNVNNFYLSKMQHYDVKSSCTITSTCRCHGFYHF
jgi:hypothetical protein